MCVWCASHLNLWTKQTKKKKEANTLNFNQLTFDFYRCFVFLLLNPSISLAYDGEINLEESRLTHFEP